MYLWLKSFHLVAMVAWFAGLFYLPRLFVYHAQTNDLPGIERFKVMERRLLRGIMTPAAVVTVALGLAMAVMQGWHWVLESGWFQVKLALVGILVIYHAYLGRLTSAFARDQNRHSHVFFRWINEFPVIVLVGAIVLAELKPF